MKIDKNRNITYDAVKALAIWLVVLGHCLQYISGLAYWNDKLFQFIYSFHMPLFFMFFMVSGFFFASSMKLGLWDFLRKKTLTLLLPCFAWGIVEAVAKFDAWSQLAADILLLSHWPFWFFKGLFLVQVFVYAEMRLIMRMGGLKFRICSLALLILLVYAMPYMAVPRVMLPMFWIGYVMKMKYVHFVIYHRSIGVCALVLFCGLYYFWNAETMHYSASASVTIYHVLLGKHGYTGMNLLTLGYRILLGAAGSVAIIAVMHEIKSVNKYISLIGTSTAGIYVLQTYIVPNGIVRVLRNYIDLSLWPLLCNFALMFVISIVMVVIITWLYRLMRRSTWVDMLFLGCGELVRK